MNIQERLAEIKARCEKATEGPWQLGFPGEESAVSMGTVYTADLSYMSYKEGGERFPKSVAGFHWGCSCCDSGAESMTDEDCANGHLLANSREDIPWLISQVEELMKEKASLERELDRARRQEAPDVPEE